jgi:hypothetical protein
MKAIDRRLRRLQERFAPQENEEVGRLVALLRERRRRRLEASGEPFVEEPESAEECVQGNRKIRLHTRRWLRVIPCGYV